MKLDDMIRSRGFDAFRSDKLGNNLFINDPERADRIYKAAENGTDGSFHCEVIEDWREYLDLLRVIDPEFTEDGGDITEAEYNAIAAEINECEQWHEKNGSLYNEIG